LSLRVRLLLAAAGIVVVSLLLSGALTWVLVRSLEFENAHIGLDRLARVDRITVLRNECLTLPPPNTTNCPQNKLASPQLYDDRLRAIANNAGDRMLLLKPDGTVIFDSRGAEAVGSRIQLPGRRKIESETVNEGDFQLAGQDYIGGGVALMPKRDPIGSGYLVFARSSSSISALAAQRLLPRLAEAGAIALVVALVIALLFSRAFARPLSELAGAAEEIAAGNYSTRVSVVGRDEIGVVGRSFNRMAEAVEHARTLQRDFLANVSHELKTPLTSLLGFSQALVDGSLSTPDERARAARIIHEEAERVLRMSQALLDLARVEAGQISLHSSEVDLQALLEQEIEIIRPRAAERGLKLALKTPAGLPPLKTDAEHLHQILANLLDNAVKYAKPDSTAEVLVSNGLLHVEITVVNRVDRHPPDPQRMFDRFYRADPSRSSAAGGVGLGLAISRELAGALRGNLKAELHGRELRVSLTLPST
jgi:signal transduction histidine kinase